MSHAVWEAAVSSPAAVVNKLLLVTELLAVRLLTHVVVSRSIQAQSSGPSGPTRCPAKQRVVLRDIQARLTAHHWPV